MPAELPSHEGKGPHCSALGSSLSCSVLNVTFPKDRIKTKIKQLLGDGVRKYVMLAEAENGYVEAKCCVINVRAISKIKVQGIRVLFYKAVTDHCCLQGDSTVDPL